MPDNPNSTLNLLRRLQRHNDSEPLVNVTPDTETAFALQPDPLPEAGQGFVNVTVYPQDPFVSEPEVRQMTASYISSGLVNARFQMRDPAASPAQPDDQGNYMFWPGKPEFDQLNSFYYATFTLRMYERYAQRALPWSFQENRLSINPHAGVGGNAYYSELDRLLGFNGFQDGNATVQSAQSADIVSHETGHAVLDGMRDLYNESFGLGPNAFHESFGDMTAVLVALHDDSLIQRLLEWTKGDLRVDNFIGVIAEQVTRRLQARGETMLGRTVYLRNAFNKFIDVPFDQLPVEASDPGLELSREKHNYSRLFTGAFYDLLVAVYERTRQTPADRIAIHGTRDIVGNLLVTAIELGPVCELTFSDMAKAFIAADILLHDGKYTDLLIDIFDRRKILPAGEAQSHIQALKSLPKLFAPAAVESPEAALQFLTAQAVPVLNLPPDVAFTPLTALKNGAGNMFMTFAAARRITLEGSEYLTFTGSYLDIFGGLTLAFDSTGQLRSVCFRPVTDEDVRQIKLITAGLIAGGYVAPLAEPSGTAFPAAYNIHETTNTRLLLRNPVLIDRLPTQFVDMIANLIEQLRRKFEG